MIISDLGAGSLQDACCEKGKISALVNVIEILGKLPPISHDLKIFPVIPACVRQLNLHGYSLRTIKPFVDLGHLLSICFRYRVELKIELSIFGKVPEILGQCALVFGDFIRLPVAYLENFVEFYDELALSPNNILLYNFFELCSKHFGVDF